MPQLIEHIDAIARKKQRDVLYIEFRPESGRLGDARELPLRQQIIEWLEKQSIGWQPCGEFANESRMRSYCGQIYVDVPFTPGDPVYDRLVAYLEHPDGSMRFAEAVFCALPLDVAMRNAHHDAPGFWERWAENF